MGKPLDSREVRKGRYSLPSNGSLAKIRVEREVLVERDHVAKALLLHGLYVVFIAGSKNSLFLKVAQLVERRIGWDDLVLGKKLGAVKNDVVYEFLLRINAPASLVQEKEGDAVLTEQFEGGAGVFDVGVAI